MPNAQKIEQVASIKGRIAASEALLLTEYRGLSVHDATELRRSLSTQAKFMVIKNTLLRRAADESGMEDLDQLITGPTAVAFVSGDVVAAAKQVVDAAKKFPSLVLKGGWLDGRLLSADQARSLADLEPRDVMLSKIAGMLKSEMTRAASMFQALQSRFVSLLEAYKDKITPAEPEAPEAPVEAEAPAPAEESASPPTEEVSAAEVADPAQAEADPGAAAPEPDPPRTDVEDQPPGEE